jgi:hypothetical protein
LNFRSFAGDTPLVIIIIIIISPSAMFRRVSSASVAHSIQSVAQRSSFGGTAVAAAAMPAAINPLMMAAFTVSAVSAMFAPVAVTVMCEEKDQSMFQPSAC